MTGHELLRRLKQMPTLKHIPVIMETALNDVQSIQNGLSAGAYYYLTKPFLPEVLGLIVKAAVEQYRSDRQLRKGVRCADQPFMHLDSGVFRFRTLESARMMANVLASSCPDPAKAVIGFQELLVNAVEHGNLDISYQEKTALVKAGRWQAEVEHRISQDEYRHRQVEVHFQRLTGFLEFVIRDQGDGFDWKKYLDFDPDRAFDTHGRGIAMANQLSLDLIEYQGTGNTVRVTVRL